MQKINQQDYVIAMCIEGKLLSSEELSKAIDNVSLSGKSTIDFIIGGSYGLSNAVKSRANLKLSMSRMTFPHQMARMILSEQIYRAFEISTNGKYHK
jgi:23S rRNA (pseudouridine1915-N3)-methyltransferase